jgi:excisionase family DNA binding protein
MRNGYPPIVIKKVDRKRYIGSIRSSQLRGEHTPFIDLVARDLEQALDLWNDAFSSKPRDYISLAEAAKRSRYSQEYLSLLVRNGMLPGVKFGRNWKVTIEDIESYEREHSNG